MQECVFCKIANHEAAASIVYEDDQVIAFKDIHPRAPVHVLVVPKKHIEDFYHVAEDALFEPIHASLKKLIDDNHFMDQGYKIEVNGGGSQLVNHLHFHLLGPVAKPL